MMKKLLAFKTPAIAVLSLLLLSAAPALADRDKALDQIDKNLEKHGGSHQGLDNAYSNVSKDRASKGNKDKSKGKGKSKKWDEADNQDMFDVEPAAGGGDDAMDAKKGKHSYQSFDDRRQDEIRQQRDKNTLKDIDNMQQMNRGRKSDRSPRRGMGYYGR